MRSALAACAGVRTPRSGSAARAMPGRSRRRACLPRVPAHHAAVPGAAGTRALPRVPLTAAWRATHVRFTVGARGLANKGRALSVFVALGRAVFPSAERESATSDSVRRAAVIVDPNGGAPPAVHCLPLGVQRRQSRARACVLGLKGLGAVKRPSAWAHPFQTFAASARAALQRVPQRKMPAVHGPCTASGPACLQACRGRSSTRCGATSARAGRSALIGI